MTIKIDFQTNNVRLKFGTQFTDHMMKMEYDGSCGGWQEPEITKLANLSLHPAAKVLQYATTVNNYLHSRFVCLIKYSRDPIIRGIGWLGQRG